jgi:aspartokinase/homoserine dehydrogenase 1
MDKFNVYKFGGTSVGSSETIFRATQIIAKAHSKVLVVVSALAGTTDKLLNGAKFAARGDLSYATAAVADFRFRHQEAINSLVHTTYRRSNLERYLSECIDDYQAICNSIFILRDCTSRIMDASVARGERMMARVVNACLEEQDRKCSLVDALEVIKVERRSGSMVPNMELCVDAVNRVLIPMFTRQSDIIVVPGFIGAGPEGEVVTLGRGGSDYSATILASCLRAESVTLFKEVDGLLTTDPKIVKNARVIPTLHYREAAELAYYGAKVLHPRSIIPLLEHNIPLVIKNSFNPDYPGTIISGEMPRDTLPVKALTAMRYQTLVTMEGNSMLGVPGIAARMFNSLARNEISISVISQASSEASICFVVPDDQAEKACHSLTDEFKYEIKSRQINGIVSTSGLAVIAVVGIGMKGTPGIAARTFAAMANHQINILAIAQGSSELNISFVVKDADLQAALLALHDEYQLDKLRPLPVRSGRQVEIALLGTGQIGTSLIRQIRDQSSYFTTTLGINCKFIGLADSKGFALCESGFSPDDLSFLVENKKDGKTIADNSAAIAKGEPFLGGGRDASLTNSPAFGNVESFLGGPLDVPKAYCKRLIGLALNRGILVDATAIDSAPFIKEAVLNKISVVLANKKPLAIPQSDYDELFSLAREAGASIRYEATVGAGLPVLDTLDKLEASGDEVLEIVGCLSGTLGYIMTRLEDGASFSEAVKGAFAAGYTEPDPTEDLSGQDVARKGLILLRRIGKRLDFSDIDLTPLCPNEDTQQTPVEFLDSLQRFDQEFRERVQKASHADSVLRYVARLTRGGLSVGLETVPQASPLGRLRGTENQIIIRTKRYDANPLVVSGPGAGAEVTAAGVLNDIIAIATQGSGHRR